MDYPPSAVLPLPRDGRFVGNTGRQCPSPLAAQGKTIPEASLGSSPRTGSDERRRLFLKPTLAACTIRYGLVSRRPPQIPSKGVFRGIRTQVVRGYRLAMPLSVAGGDAPSEDEARRGLLNLSHQFRLRRELERLVCEHIITCPFDIYTICREEINGSTVRSVASIFRRRWDDALC